LAPETETLDLKPLPQLDVEKERRGGNINDHGHGGNWPNPCLLPVKGGTGGKKE